MKWPSQQDGQPTPTAMYVCMYVSMHVLNTMKISMWYDCILPGYIIIYNDTTTANHAFSIHWPAPRLLRSLPPAVPTSTVKVYSVVGSRLSITTLESVVLIVLIAPATRPAWTEEGWYVTKYTGNPLAWWRVSGVQLTRALLLLMTLSTFTLLTWTVGAVHMRNIYSSSRIEAQTRHAQQHKELLYYRTARWRITPYSVL